MANQITEIISDDVGLGEEGVDRPTFCYVFSVNSSFNVVISLFSSEFEITAEGYHVKAYFFKKVDFKGGLEEYVC